MASVRDLERCAAEHFFDYTRPGTARAFQAYDRIGDPSTLEPVDLLAPALLDAPIRGRYVIEMFGEESPYRTLRRAMQAVLDTSESRSARFEDQDLDATEGPWALVRAALTASDATPGMKASMVTKILHRKRPLLVPIFDSKVAAFFGESSRKPGQLWPKLQADLRSNAAWLGELGAVTRTPDDRAVSPLRVLDIIVWGHMVSSPACPG